MPGVALDTLVHALSVGQRRARLLGRPVLVSTVFPWPGPRPTSVWEAAAARPEPPGVAKGLLPAPAGESFTGEADTGEASSGQGPAVEAPGCSLLADAREGLAIFAWKAAAVLSGTGAARFSEVRRRWAALLRDAVVLGDEGHPATGPLAVGGFAFDPAPSRDPVWEGFPDAFLTVPRIALTESEQGCWLSLNVLMAAEGSAEAAGRALQEELDLLAALAAARRAELPQPAGRLELDESEGARWLAQAEEAASAVRAGSLRKVVLARRVAVRAGGWFDVARVVRALRQEQPDCCVFAFGAAGRWFVGATPERLARVEGRRLETAALAGSAPRGRSAEEDQRLAEGLLHSPKERLEHGLVVQAVTEALRPLCAALDVPERPDVVKLASLQHLHTPICGQLRPGISLLDVVERLHPTPAVGGLPRQAALEWLRAHEGLDRGWYAGPVGWVDARGGGEFWVAIRSGLVMGPQAFLFAGCGILADSDPRSEERELRLKLRPMLGALQRSLEAEGERR